MMILIPDRHLECKYQEHAMEAVTALCAKFMRPFHFVMCCSYFVMGYLIWLCDL